MITLLQLMVSSMGELLYCLECGYLAHSMIEVVPNSETPAKVSQI